MPIQRRFWCKLWCMPSLISDADKASLVAAFQDLADTFARPITAYKEAERVVLSTNPNFNRLNKFDQTSTSSTFVPVYTTFNARVMYASNMQNPLAQLIQMRHGYSQEKIRMPEGQVRIKVDYSGYAYMQDVKEVELDGNKFEVDSLERPHGIFSTGYFTYWLKRLL